MFFRRLFLGAILLVGFGWISLVYSIPNVPNAVADAPIEINNDDESIVPAPSRAANAKVQKGDIYDKGTLKTADIKSLIVPDNAIVERTGTEGAIELYVKKTQSFGGHPPEPMTLESARKKMGCATKEENGKVTLATYGEFSTKEGGAHLKLLLRVPASLIVETQPDLSGPKSAGHRKLSGAYLTKEPDAKDGYWYGPASAGPGWKAIPMEPDVKRTAK